ncbi:hypothetical protein CSB07_00490 [Candidatus Gracilibacteria bacterium]|nr:MAG: hypothetical protein CSB07_00490 [Candidatus Gracilibacteria bacterium]
MKKILIILAIIIIAVAAAGIYKFNYLSNEPGYDVDGNKIKTEKTENTKSDNILKNTSKNSQTVSSKLRDISTKIPDSLDSVYKNNFNRYTKVVAPNGNAIHIVAQDKISDEQILRARNILMHYLNNFPDSKYGRDKSAVANKMADNNSVLALLNGPRGWSK